MKKILCILSSVSTMLAVLLISVLALAQELPVPIPDVTNAEFFEFLLKSLGGAKGAQTLALVALGLQILFKLLGTPMFAQVWLKIPGNIKFLLVALISIASMVVAQMQLGLTFAAAILHATVVTSLMNYAYRFYERFVEKKV